MAAELSAIETSGAQEKRPELSRRTGGWRSEAPAGWGCPARVLQSSQPVSSQCQVSRPERQVTPPTPAVTRALADNGTISRSTSAPETPCHRPGTCATPARAREQWMRGSGARSSGCSGAAPAHWHCVDLAALDNGAGAASCEFGQLSPGNRVVPVPQPLRHRARTLVWGAARATKQGHETYFTQLPTKIADAPWPPPGATCGSRKIVAKKLPGPRK